MDVRVGTLKKAEHQIIDAFELWCWRLLRVPWTAKRSNQSILKKINPEYSLEGLMLKLKLQYFGYLMQRTNPLVKTLIMGKIEAGEGDDRRWDGWIASPTWWTWIWVGSRSWWWAGKPGVMQSVGLQRVRHDWLNWTVVIYIQQYKSKWKYYCLFTHFFVHPCIWSNMSNTTIVMTEQSVPFPYLELPLISRCSGVFVISSVIN